MTKQADTKIYAPLPIPLPVVDKDPREELTATEQEQYNEVLAYFSKEAYELPNVEPPTPLEDVEKFWLSRECLLRYLRASKWKTQIACQRLESTLKWRREYGLYDRVVTSEHVEPEAVTGKLTIFGYDVDGRPAFYLFPSRQNTDNAATQIQFTVYMLEKCVNFMGPGVETIDLMINYAQKAKSPPFSTSRTVLNILQDHYPERLGRSLIIHVPFLINAFYKAISPFIDPITREKMRFNPEVIKENLFTPDQVMKEWWGGGQDFFYEHDKYWPALVESTNERQKVWFEKWKTLGGKVGIKEWEYKSGDEAVAKRRAEKGKELADAASA